jgi:alkylresorcinol/alkylpyrone synthase
VNHLPHILSVAHSKLPYLFTQEKISEFARGIFKDAYKDIDRLLQAFVNGQVEARYFAKELSWYKSNPTFEEKNEAFIEAAVTYGSKAIKLCLDNSVFLKEKIPFEEIDAFIYISSTGLSTPSIEARIMNVLPFSIHTKRIPIWGLGCAGGASGLARAFEYCKAYPEAKVIVLTVELCSLTFQRDDLSKSNLIGTSLFSDGVACALVCGDRVELNRFALQQSSPEILACETTLMPDSLDVMGWGVKNDGLHVIFSKDIPTIVKKWLKPNVDAFLAQHHVPKEKIAHFIAHPGGKKVVEAYQETLGFGDDMTQISMNVLKQFGNMSSATILYVLEKFMTKQVPSGDYGLAAALGPGFCSELLLMRWR